MIRALLRARFRESHVRGSHHYLRRENGGLVVIPVHGNRVLPLGTLRSILRQAGLSEEELRSLLGE